MGFDIKTIINNLLKPIEEEKEIQKSIKLLDLYSDQYKVKKKYLIDRETIVIFEGVFLFRKELTPYIDYKVFLDIPFEESKKRAEDRDIDRFGKEIIEKYGNKYLPTQKRYLTEYPPSKLADLVIDNTNLEYPIIKNY